MRLNEFSPKQTVSWRQPAAIHEAHFESSGGSTHKPVDARSRLGTDVYEYSVSENCEKCILIALLQSEFLTQVYGLRRHLYSYKQEKLRFEVEKRHKVLRTFSVCSGMTKIWEGGTKQGEHKKKVGLKMNVLENVCWERKTPWRYMVKEGNYSFLAPGRSLIIRALWAPPMPPATTLQLYTDTKYSGYFKPLPVCCCRNLWKIRRCNPDQWFPGGSCQRIPVVLSVKELYSQIRKMLWFLGVENGCFFCGGRNSVLNQTSSQQGESQQCVAFTIQAVRPGSEGVVLHGFTNLQVHVRNARPNVELCEKRKTPTSAPLGISSSPSLTVRSGFAKCESRWEKPRLSQDVFCHWIFITTVWSFKKMCVVTMWSWGQSFSSWSGWCATQNWDFLFISFIVNAQSTFLLTELVHPPGMSDKALVVSACLKTSWTQNRTRAISTRNENTTKTIKSLNDVCAVLARVVVVFYCFSQSLYKYGAFFPSKIQYASLFVIQLENTWFSKLPGRASLWCPGLAAPGSVSTAFFTRHCYHYIRRLTFHFISWWRTEISNSVVQKKYNWNSTCGSFAIWFCLFRKW